MWPFEEFFFQSLLVEALSIHASHIQGMIMFNSSAQHQKFILHWNVLDFWLKTYASSSSVDIRDVSEAL